MITAPHKHKFVLKYERQVTLRIFEYLKECSCGEIRTKAWLV